MPARAYRRLVVTVLLGVTCAASAATWLELAPDGTWRLTDAGAAQAPLTEVLYHDASGFALATRLTGIELSTLEIAGGEFTYVGWPRAALAGEIGGPTLPVVRKLFVAPRDAAVSLNVAAGQPTCVTLAELGLNTPPLPTQQPVSRDPADLATARQVLDPQAYAAAGWTLGDRAVLTPLGFVRGLRLFLLEMRPVDYDAAAGVLALYRDMQVTVRFDGATGFDVALAPALAGVVLNPPSTGLLGRGAGNFLIVHASIFDGSTALNQLVAARTARGFNVATYSVPAGTTAAAIRAYVQGLWGTPDAPDYLLLIGDTDTIPTFVGGGNKHADTDLPFACMDGASDWYPDMYLGRIAARTEERLQNVVSKTIYVENGVYTDPDYPRRAQFVAANDELSGDEEAHNHVIDTYMTPNGYLPNKVYMRTYGHTLTSLIQTINQGAGWVIYYGHSGMTNWMGYNLEPIAVRGFTNANKYPIVLSFSCNSARVSWDECFGECWTEQPNKAGVVYISATNFTYVVQNPWLETQNLEWSFFDAVYLDQLHEIGPAWQGGLWRFLALYGPTTPVTRDYFEMFELIGDPSCPVPLPNTFTLDAAPAAQAICTSSADQVQYTIDVTRLGEFNDPVQLVVHDLPAGALADFSVNNAVPPFTSVLTVSNLAAAAVGAYELEITGTAPSWERTTVVDLHIASGPPATVTLTSPGNGATEVDRTPTLTWQPLASAAGYTVQVATNAAFSNVVFSATVDAPSVQVGPALLEGTLYYWRVRGANACGDGPFSAPYTFLTVNPPDYFSEQFDDTLFDLEHFSVTFTPDGSQNYYAACSASATALPTDPTGGTTLALSDDGSAQITPSAAVLLYGTAYSSLWVNANGHMTFTMPDGTSDESFDMHFGIPRVSVLFDDLNPAAGGTVSWRDTGDRVAISWVNIHEYNTTNENTFQAELFYDGTIRLTWLRVDVNDALVGLSAGGGVPGNFAETAFSAIPACACRGDCNCDGQVSWRDIDYFVAAMNDNVSAWEAMFAPHPPTCTFANCDVNADGTVTWRDIDALVGVMNTVCP